MAGRLASAEPGAPAPSSADSLVEQLSPRRREILELVAKGLGNDDIAAILGITAGTVRIHMTTVLAELHVANRTEAAAAYHAFQAGPSRVSAVLARPAIAVLPFAAAGRAEGAPGTASAITHDLTTLFARWCWFPVIAGTSAARVRAAGGSPRELGRTLGARFLVDGTLRVAPSSWRLHVRLDDVEVGRCLWAERYDFPRGEVFDVQDAVCEAIVATAYEVLIKGLTGRVVAPRHPDGVDAWALAHDGMILHARREPAASAQALASFAQALERDPHLVLAHVGQGLCHYDDVLNQWGNTRGAEGQLLACAQRVIELAPHAAEGYFLQGRHQQARGRHGHAVEPLQKAIARNPSFAAAHALLAQLLVLSGRPDEGLARLEHAHRLAPRSYVAGLAAFHFLRGEMGEALEHAERALLSNPRYAFGLVMAAASAFHLGDRARAEQHAGALRELHPGFCAARFLATFGPGFAGVDGIARALGSLGFSR
jgi:TolB-like protein/Flp pilus assembly protein TadD